ncbi:amino acid ABC transporter permease [Kutzneria viridogrisea]
MFGLALLAVAWFVYRGLDAKGQFAAAMWTPFLDADVWENFILPGLELTLLAAALSIVIALPFGAVLGIGRLSEHRWVRVPVAVVVEFFRAIPVLILMIFANQYYADYTDIGSDNRGLYAVVTGLVLYNASVLAEVVRAGILSLPKGQSEAAYALGLRKTQIMVSVLLPQAVKVMLPAILSQLVVILKDTALGGAAVAAADLLRSGTLISGNYNNAVPTYIVIGAIYVVINLLLTWAASLLQKRWSRGSRSTPQVTVTAAVGTATAA